MKLTLSFIFVTIGLLQMTAASPVAIGDTSVLASFLLKYSLG
jgi:hypothetical protein